MARGTGFRGPLGFSAPNLPFDGIPLRVADTTFQQQFLAFMLGHGTYQGPAAAGTENGIVVTDVAGTSAVTSDADGRLVLTTGTTDENSGQIQFKRPQFTHSTTKAMTFAARVKTSTQATTGVFVGLASVDTTVWTAAAGAVDVDDGIFFYKDATATDWTFHVRKDSTSTTQAMGLTLAADTYSIVMFTVRSGVIRAYAINDSANVLRNTDNAVGVARPFGAGLSVANTNAPDDADLCPSLLCGQEGGTTARVLTVDWMFCVQEHA